MFQLPIRRFTKLFTLLPNGLPWPNGSSYSQFAEKTCVTPPVALSAALV
jgi:hypothetical protein